jgi:hypothetical protein
MRLTVDPRYRVIVLMYHKTVSMFVLVLRVQVRPSVYVDPRISSIVLSARLRQVLLEVCEVVFNFSSSCFDRR